MKMRADPLLLAVALGLLNPSVFEVDSDGLGESQPPPMLERALDLDEYDVDEVDED